MIGTNHGLACRETDLRLDNLFIMENIIDKIRIELRKNSDNKTQTTSQKFFKEKIKSYGVKVPSVHKISIPRNKFRGYLFGRTPDTIKCR